MLLNELWLERGGRNEVVIKGVGEVLGCRHGCTSGIYVWFKIFIFG